MKRTRPTWAEHAGRFNALLGYSWRTRRYVYLIVLPLLVMWVVLLLLGGGAWDRVAFAYGKADSLIGLITLLVAVFVWWGELSQDWIGHLPKQLSVTFELEGREVMRCARADLASEAEIRTLSQQIGKQMAQANLSFLAPAIRQTGGRIERQADKGFVRHYRVTFHLTAPSGILAELDSDEYLIWEPPFTGPADRRSRDRTPLS